VSNSSVKAFRCYLVGRRLFRAPYAGGSLSGNNNPINPPGGTAAAKLLVTAAMLSPSSSKTDWWKKYIKPLLRNRPF